MDGNPMICAQTRDISKDSSDFLSIPEQISKFGRKVVSGGLVEGNFGNISIRSMSSDDISSNTGTFKNYDTSGNCGCMDVLTITKTGTSLDELDNESIVTVPVNASNDAEKSENERILEKQASSELKVHRAIYQKTNAKAILHVHAPYAVTMSILEAGLGNTELVPVDSEGILFLNKIPIVYGGIGSDELAKAASDAFSKNGAKVIIVHGHGTFAIGNTLKEAYIATTQAEHAAQIAYLCNSAKHLY